jgi:peptidoglycan/LPS O-acetylase OafA/YrhL
MGFLLGFGDSFHLVPRIVAHLTTGLADYQMALGVGKLITGITMTVFYYLIYLFYTIKTKVSNKKIHISIIALILLRFVFLALPGNDWLNNGTDIFYGVLRNIPFAVLGTIIVVLFFQVGKQEEFIMFKQMGIWIIVSFVCYIIVVVGSEFVPVLGALMMPKTMAYFIIVYIGYKNC